MPAIEPNKKPIKMRIGKSAKTLFYCVALGRDATYEKVRELTGLASIASIEYHVKKLKKLGLLEPDFMSLKWRRSKYVSVDRADFQARLNSLKSLECPNQRAEEIDALIYELEEARPKQ